jgi:cytochrome c556
VRRMHRGAVSRGRLRICRGITLAGALVVAVSAPCAQDQKAATAADAIVARKTVMEALSDKMDDIEGAISAGKVNLDQAHAAADTISVFLMAFPHLFPAATNQWKPTGDRDPATDTFASPDVWTRFADFYQQAAAASKSAFAASRSQSEADLKTAIARLRTQCNTCHEAYLKN